jgi:hypothetical protein
MSEREYNIFRWYRPNWGRYSQADPASLLGGFNLFSYALGNPMGKTDRYGLMTFGFIGGTVRNFSSCCVVVSESESMPGGKGERRRYLPPGGGTGFVDIDAVYFRDGSALKIPDGSYYVITDCAALDRAPMGIFARPVLAPVLSPILRYLDRPPYDTKVLPDQPSQETEFGGPILAPPPDCKCK